MAGRGVTLTLTRAQVSALLRAVGVVEMTVEAKRLDYSPRAWFDLHEAANRLEHALRPGEATP